MNNDGVTETTWSKLGGVDENWTHSELRVPPNTNQVNILPAFQSTITLITYSRI